MTALFEARTAREPDAAAAYRHLTKGTLATQYRVGLVLATVVTAVLAIAVLMNATPVVGAVGGLAAAAGIGLGDDAFVKAGQSVPLT